ncbi:unnamed protein product [Amoebophrya sp. A120]|nr:unnamed protein product [Amoebophrya sp. A120]|eukprot:GSA120T00010763001.1
MALTGAPTSGTGPNGGGARKPPASFHANARTLDAPDLLLKFDMEQIYHRTSGTPLRFPTWFATMSEGAKQIEMNQGCSGYGYSIFQQQNGTVEYFKPLNAKEKEILFRERPVVGVGPQLTEGVEHKGGDVAGGAGPDSSRPSASSEAKKENLFSLQDKINQPTSKNVPFIPPLSLTQVQTDSNTQTATAAGAEATAAPRPSSKTTPFVPPLRLDQVKEGTSVAPVAKQAKAKAKNSAKPGAKGKDATKNVQSEIPEHMDVLRHDHFRTRLTELRMKNQQVKNAKAETKAKREAEEATKLRRQAERTFGPACISNPEAGTILAGIENSIDLNPSEKQQLQQLQVKHLCEKKKLFRAQKFIPMEFRDFLQEISKKGEKFDQFYCFWKNFITTNKAYINFSNYDWNKTHDNINFDPKHQNDHISSPKKAKEEAAVAAKADGNGVKDASNKGEKTEEKKEDSSTSKPESNFTEANLAKIRNRQNELGNVLRCERMQQGQKYWTNLFQPEADGGCGTKTIVYGAAASSNGGQAKKKNGVSSAKTPVAVVSPPWWSPRLDAPRAITWKDESEKDVEKQMKELFYYDEALMTEWFWWKHHLEEPASPELLKTSLAEVAKNKAAAAALSAQSQAQAVTVLSTSSSAVATDTTTAVPAPQIGGKPPLILPMQINLLHMPPGITTPNILNAVSLAGVQLQQQQPLLQLQVPTISSAIAAAPENIKVKSKDEAASLSSSKKELSASSAQNHGNSDAVAQASSTSGLMQNSTAGEGAETTTANKGSKEKTSSSDTGAQSKVDLHIKTTEDAAAAPGLAPGAEQEQEPSKNLINNPDFRDGTPDAGPVVTQNIFSSSSLGAPPQRKPNPDAFKVSTEDKPAGDHIEFRHPSGVPVKEPGSFRPNYDLAKKIRYIDEIEYDDIFLGNENYAEDDDEDTETLQKTQPELHLEGRVEVKMSPMRGIKEVGDVFHFGDGLGAMEKNAGAFYKGDKIIAQSVPHPPRLGITNLKLPIPGGDAAGTNNRGPHVNNIGAATPSTPATNGRQSVFQLKNLYYELPTSTVGGLLSPSPAKSSAAPLLRSSISAKNLNFEPPRFGGSLLRNGSLAGCSPLRERRSTFHVGTPGVAGLASSSSLRSPFQQFRNDLSTSNKRCAFTPASRSRGVFNGAAGAPSSGFSPAPAAGLQSTAGNQTNVGHNINRLNDQQQNLSFMSVSPEKKVAAGDALASSETSSAWWSGFSPAPRVVKTGKQNENQAVVFVGAPVGNTTTNKKEDGVGSNMAGCANIAGASTCGPQSTAAAPQTTNQVLGPCPGRKAKHLQPPPVPKLAAQGAAGPEKQVRELLADGSKNVSTAAAGESSAPSLIPSKNVDATSISTPRSDMAIV